MLERPSFRPSGSVSQKLTVQFSCDLLGMYLLIVERSTPSFIIIHPRDFELWPLSTLKKGIITITFKTILIITFLILNGCLHSWTQQPF